MSKRAVMSFRVYRQYGPAERILHGLMRSGDYGNLYLRLGVLCSSCEYRDVGCIVAPSGMMVDALRRVSEIPAGVQEGVPLPVELIDYDKRDGTWSFTVSV